MSALEYCGRPPRQLIERQAATTSGRSPQFHARSFASSWSFCKTTQRALRNHYLSKCNLIVRSSFRRSKLHLIFGTVVSAQLCIHVRAQLSNLNAICRFTEETMKTRISNWAQLEILLNPAEKSISLTFLGGIRNFLSLSVSLQKAGIFKIILAQLWGGLPC